MRKIFTIAIIALSMNVIGQVPTNGLVGYWPFNGNANDASGSSNNGTVHGATLTNDRFGNANSAYKFNRTTYISVAHNANLNIINAMTISFFFNDSVLVNNINKVIQKGVGGSCNYQGYCVTFDNNFGSLPSYVRGLGYGNNDTCAGIADSSKLNSGWHNITIVYSPPSNSIYFDGILQDGDFSELNSYLITNTNYPLEIGGSNSGQGYIGDLDDIGIWNRALSPSEITQINNSGICYQTITVTDTLIINANLAGFNPIAYQNTIKIYPNPTNDHITINFGNNYSTMNGYTLKITNSLSQIVYITPINSQQTTVDLSTWTGNGIYFVHLIDATSNTIDIRKIVLQ